jgi:hypothetical protein
MDALDAVLDVWSTLEPRIQQSTRNLVQPLADLLVPDEEVEVLATVVLHAEKGLGGLLAMTDRRLIFVALTGLLGRNVQSLDVPYSSIAGLNVGKAGVWMVEVSSGAGDFHFSPGSRDGAVQLANLIRQCIDEYNRPEPAQMVSAVDPMDQLRKLAELHDAGVVTDEEFAAKKAKLLDQV